MHVLHGSQGTGHLFNSAYYLARKGCRRWKESNREKNFNAETFFTAYKRCFLLHFDLYSIQ